MGVGTVSKFHPFKTANLNTFSGLTQGRIKHLSGLDTEILYELF
jgi:hypothetical protein